jgi:DNA-3-methyladenine glycosylase II
VASRAPGPPRRVSLQKLVGDEGLERLRASDDTLARVIDERGPLDLDARVRGRPQDAYGALLRAIVGQQLSVAAARTIYNRFTDLFGGRTPTPEELLEVDADTLRGVGFSRAKAGYIRSLAEHIISGELELDRLDELPDEEVARELIAVKGLGQWSVDMFLIFHLGRPDVLPVGDLGVRRAVERLYGLEALPSAAELEALGERWRPYRSLASLYLWESLDNAPA